MFLMGHPIALMKKLTKPINVYGATKIRGEKCVWPLIQCYILERPGCTVHLVIICKTMQRLLKERDTLGGDQIGSPTYADLRKRSPIVQSPKWIPGIYNYSNEGEISWYDFAWQ
jgi:dTDP-4-dehydrorhamnose reductase